MQQEDSKSFAASFSQNNMKLDQTILNAEDVPETDEGKEDDSVFNHPIILLPGFAGSKIEAKLNKTRVPHSYCSKTTEWYTLWITPSQLFPWLIDCFKENFVRVFNDTTGKTQNAEGVETRVPGWGDTTTIEYISNYHLSPGNYSAFAEVLTTFEFFLYHCKGLSQRH